MCSYLLVLEEEAGDEGLDLVECVGVNDGVLQGEVLDDLLRGALHDLLLLLEVGVGEDLVLLLILDEVG